MGTIAIIITASLVLGTLIYSIYNFNADSGENI
jgi:hypothetical protein